MTAANKTGFMGQPAASAAELAAPPQPQPAMPERFYHWAYSLPTSVMDQYHWRGTEADLHYGLCEPSLDDIARIGRDPDRQIREVAVGFIRGLARMGSDGKVILGDDGHPKLFPVGYMEVEAWLGRIGAKGAQLVIGEFQASFQPSRAEGEAHRTSRRRG